jgi:alanine racemase
MAGGTLTINLDAIVANWRALDALSSSATQTAAVIKADGYGLGAGRVAVALAQAGARSFFVALAEEGRAVRAAVGPGPQIGVFSGHQAGDTDALRAADLIPMLNSPQQVARHVSALPEQTFGIQLNSGMNRLGMEAADWAAVRGDLPRQPWLVMSHLACADAPDHPQNAAQLAAFRAMTDGVSGPRSLAATGGILLGPAYHFDLTRPGIGLYGGLPFAQGVPVAELALPVIQCRDVAPGDSVGYGASWVASRPSRIATVSAGYADGLIRSMSNRAMLYAAGTPCKLAGRVSMDLLTVDVTDLPEDPETLLILGPYQGVDVLAEAAGTIGYEVLTSLGQRYQRRYTALGA